METKLLNFLAQNLKEKRLIFEDAPERQPAAQPEVQPAAPPAAPPGEQPAARATVGEPVAETLVEPASTTFTYIDNSDGYEYRKSTRGDNPANNDFRRRKPPAGSDEYVYQTYMAGIGWKDAPEYMQKRFAATDRDEAARVAAAAEAEKARELEAARVALKAEKANVEGWNSGATAGRIRDELKQLTQGDDELKGAIALRIFPDSFQKEIDDNFAAIMAILEAVDKPTSTAHEINTTVTRAEGELQKLTPREYIERHRDSIATFTPLLALFDQYIISADRGNYAGEVLTQIRDAITADLKTEDDATIILDEIKSKFDKELAKAAVADIIGEKPEDFDAAIRYYQLGKYKTAHLNTDSRYAESRRILGLFMTNKETIIDRGITFDFFGSTNNVDHRLIRDPDWHKDKAAALEKILALNDEGRLRVDGTMTRFITDNRALIDRYTAAVKAGTDYVDIVTKKEDKFLKGGTIFDLALRLQRAAEFKRFVDGTTEYNPEIEDATDVFKTDGTEPDTYTVALLHENNKTDDARSSGIKLRIAALTTTEGDGGTTGGEAGGDEEPTEPADGATEGDAPAEPTHDEEPAAPADGAGDAAATAPVEAATEGDTAGAPAAAAGDAAVEAAPEGDTAVAAAPAEAPAAPTYTLNPENNELQVSFADGTEKVYKIDSPEGELTFSVVPGQPDDDPYVEITLADVDGVTTRLKVDPEGNLKFAPTDMIWRNYSVKLEDGEIKIEKRAEKIKDHGYELSEIDDTHYKLNVTFIGDSSPTEYNILVPAVVTLEKRDRNGIQDILAKTAAGDEHSFDFGDDEAHGLTSSTLFDEYSITLTGHEIKIEKADHDYTLKGNDDGPELTMNFIDEMQPKKYKIKIEGSSDLELSAQTDYSNLDQYVDIGWANHDTSGSWFEFTKDTPPILYFDETDYFWQERFSITLGSDGETIKIASRDPEYTLKDTLSDDKKELTVKFPGEDETKYTIEGPDGLAITKNESPTGERYIELFFGNDDGSVIEGWLSFSKTVPHDIEYDQTSDFWTKEYELKLEDKKITIVKRPEAETAQEFPAYSIDGDKLTVRFDATTEKEYTLEIPRSDEDVESIDMYVDIEGKSLKVLRIPIPWGLDYAYLYLSNGNPPELKSIPSYVWRFYSFNLADDKITVAKKPDSEQEYTIDHRNKKLTLTEGGKTSEFNFELSDDVTLLNKNGYIYFYKDYKAHRQEGRVTINIKDGAPELDIDQREEFWLTHTIKLEAGKLIVTRKPQIEHEYALADDKLTVKFIDSETPVVYTLKDVPAGMELKAKIATSGEAYIVAKKEGDIGRFAFSLYPHHNLSMEADTLWERYQVSAEGQEIVFKDKLAEQGDGTYYNRPDAPDPDKEVFVHVDADGKILTLRSVTNPKETTYKINAPEGTVFENYDYEYADEQFLIAKIGQDQGVFSLDSDGNLVAPPSNIGGLWNKYRISIHGNVINIKQLDEERPATLTFPELTPEEQAEFDLIIENPEYNISDANVRQGLFLSESPEKRIKFALAWMKMRGEKMSHSERASFLMDIANSYFTTDSPDYSPANALEYANQAIDLLNNSYVEERVKDREKMTYYAYYLKAHALNVMGYKDRAEIFYARAMEWASASDIDTEKDTAQEYVHVLADNKKYDKAFEVIEDLELGDALAIEIRQRRWKEGLDNVQRRAELEGGSFVRYGAETFFRYGAETVSRMEKSAGAYKTQIEALIAGTSTPYDLYPGSSTLNTLHLHMLEAKMYGGTPADMDRKKDLYLRVIGTKSNDGASMEFKELLDEMKAQASDKLAYVVGKEFYGYTSKLRGKERGAHFEFTSEGGEIVAKIGKKYFWVAPDQEIAIERYYSTKGDKLSYGKWYTYGRTSSGVEYILKDGKWYKLILE